jgi:hypothetical protein
MLPTLTAFAGLILLIILYRRDQRRVRAQRAEFFADCLDVLDKPKLAFDHFGYPFMTGSVDGVPVRADVIVDAVVLRKLPSLWLRVTVEAPVATTAILDVMMRPSGSEFFSPFAALPDRLDTPADWPERAIIHTDHPDRLPPPEAFTPHIAVLDEPRAKELIVSPNGVRIVWQADEAQRSNYLLLRQANFDVVRFDRERLRDLVRRCINIRSTLAATEPKELSRETAA